jgi:hypothetical protein
MASGRKGFPFQSRFASRTNVLLDQIGRKLKEALGNDEIGVPIIYALPFDRGT